MRYHPDKKTGSRAKFLEILEAYEVISGLRKAENNKTNFTTKQAEDFYEIIQKLAKEKAKAEYRKRAAKIRRQRDEEQAKEFKRGILSLVGIIILAGIGWFGYGWYFDYKIDNNKGSALAEVTAIRMNEVEYQFEVNGTLFTDQAYVHKVGVTMLAENGLPLKVGHQFKISYSKADPSYNRIEYNHVTAETLKSYLEIAKSSLLNIYSEEWQEVEPRFQDARAKCIALLTYEHYGLEGLAQLVFWDEVVLENLSHNSWSWYFFSQKKQYQELEELCRTNF